MLCNHMVSKLKNFPILPPPNKTINKIEKISTGWVAKRVYAQQNQVRTIVADVEPAQQLKNLWKRIFKVGRPNFAYYNNV